MTYYHYHSYHLSDNPILFVLELMLLAPWVALTFCMIPWVLVPLDGWLTGGVFSPIWSIFFNYEAVWSVTGVVMRILLITAIALTVWWAIKRLAKK